MPKKVPLKVILILLMGPICRWFKRIQEGGEFGVAFYKVKITLRNCFTRARGFEVSENSHSH